MRLIVSRTRFVRSCHDGGPHMGADKAPPTLLAQSMYLECVLYATLLVHQTLDGDHVLVAS